jgi:hypothetical protein
MSNTEEDEAFTSFYMEKAEQIPGEYPRLPGLGGVFASRRWFRDRPADDKEA